jgi:hypothetical protein
MATKRYKKLDTVAKTKYKNIKWKHNKKVQDEDTTRVSVYSQIQHLLRKSPSFKANLHTSQDQNHSTCIILT